MALTGDKLLSVLVDSLSVDELETLLNQKKNASTSEVPKSMTEEEKWTKHYQDEIIKYGVLHPPK